MLPGYIHISTQTAKTIGAAGSHSYLVSVCVNTAAASAVCTLTDATSGATIAVIDASAKGSYWYGGVRVPGGVTATQTGGNADLTIAVV